MTDEANRFAVSNSPQEAISGARGVVEIAVTAASQRVVIPEEWKDGSVVLAITGGKIDGQP